MSDPNPEQPPTAPVPEPTAAPAVAAEAVPEVAAEAVPETAPAEAMPAEAAAAEPAAPAIPELSPAATGALLAQHFPALFAPGQAKPIKLRIQTDIQQRVPGVFTKKSLSLFLHRHTTSTPYLKALVASPQRFDLDGQPAGEVAAEHRDAAAAEVERRRAIVQAKRQAERQAERQAQRPPRPAPAAGEANQGPVQHPQGPRPPRPERQDRPPRPDRPPHGDRPQGQRPAQEPRRERPPRHERPPHVQQQRPERQGPRPDRQDRPPRPPRPAAPAIDPAIAVLSPEEQAARRERALLLRAWETTTLTRSNFCVLKRISEADLEAQLAQARKERPAHVGVREVNPGAR